jgi:lysozyme family protein
MLVGLGGNMANFSEAYKKTLKFEGGYSNDPDDVGGETYKGISRVYNPGWSGWIVIDAAKNGPGFPSSLDANVVLQNSVGEFYKDKYWDVNRLDVFPQSVAEEMFDTGVNMGVDRAARFLQKALNYLNRNGKLYGDLDVDGKIGPASLNAMAACKDDERVILAMLNTLQGMHYMNYMDKSPSQKKYARGWFKRVG